MYAQHSRKKCTQHVHVHMMSRQSAHASIQACAHVESNESSMEWNVGQAPPAPDVSELKAYLEEQDASATTQLTKAFDLGSLDEESLDRLKKNVDSGKVAIISLGRG